MKRIHQSKSQAAKTAYPWRDSIEAALRDLREIQSTRTREQCKGGYRIIRKRLPA